MDSHRNVVATLALASLASACSGDTDGTAEVRLKNDFNNPAIAGFQPPWTLCKASYRGTPFDKIEIGQTSPTKTVPAGLDHVLMVAAWNDPDCNPAHSLPIASKIKEETVGGQTRTIAIGMTNHQGPCPPEGIPPIPKEQYDRILELWPEYAFQPYAQRAQNPQCAGQPGGSHDAGVDGAGGASADSGGDSGP